MEIKLIDIIEGNVPAWHLSRPQEVDKSFDDIADIDLPVNEFFTINIEIKSTILEREIFATQRNHIMWAQTSRVQDVLNFEPHHHLPDDYVNNIKQDMRHFASTSRQDDYRLLLPILSLTKYSISTNARQLIKLGKYFDYLGMVSRNIILADVFFCASQEIRFLLLQLGFNKEHFDNYKLDKILNEGPVEKTDTIIDDNFVIAHAELPFSLRAQLVRHRGILISDDIFHKITTDSDFKYATLKSFVNVKISASIDQAIAVSQKRNCWIAHYSMWAPLLNELAKAIPDNGLLPCSSGSCPFGRDAMLRVEGKDPNPPCPIHMDVNGINPSESQFDDMRTMVIEDNRPVLFWNDKINQLELDK